jgi:hypothetical protein
MAIRGVTWRSSGRVAVALAAVAALVAVALQLVGARAARAGEGAAYGTPRPARG